LLIPALGTLTTIWISAALCLLSGLLILFAARLIRHPAALALVVMVAVLFSVQPTGFDYTRLASGSHMYFSYRDYGTVIDHAESIDAGLITVSMSQNKETVPIKTLLTNGQFQGNDRRSELLVQLGFAVVPLLHTVARGYGNGVSARAVKEAGFSQLDIVELSRDVITLANRHFGDINKNISTQPGVTTTITDDRNYLLLQNKKYDLISLEMTSIGIAETASLYHQEFYQLAAGRLSEHGVLQQWIQLHHMSPVDLACILSTVRSVFPAVHLYNVGGQGVIIAEKTPDKIAPQAAIDLMQSKPGFMNMVKEVNLDPASIRKGLILSPGDTDRLIKGFAGSREFVISNDDNLFLEYSTPKGNALDAEKSMNQLLGFLRLFSSQK
jgi:predicted membrane-bound spermidine synthase